MITLNVKNFSKLQDELSENAMAKKIGISRSQLWRIKKENCSVGYDFITKFKTAYPDEPFEKYFNTH